jgi:hypothetical protein
MPKGARKTPEQKLAAAQAMMAKAEAEMERRAVPYGFMLLKAEKLPEKKKRILRDILAEVVTDRGDIERLNKLLGPEVTV